MDQACEMSLNEEKLDVKKNADHKKQSSVNVRRSSLFPATEEPICLISKSSTFPPAETVKFVVDPLNVSVSTIDETGPGVSARETIKMTSRRCSAESTNYASTLSVIRRKRRSRNRTQRNHFVLNIMRLVYTFLFYSGFSSVRPKPLTKSVRRIQKVSYHVFNSRSISWATWQMISGIGTYNKVYNALAVAISWYGSEEMPDPGSRKDFHWNLLQFLVEYHI